LLPLKFTSFAPAGERLAFLLVSVVALCVVQSYLAPHLLNNPLFTFEAKMSAAVKNDSANPLTFIVAPFTTENIPLT
jgi:hypothetical protein